jgi:hypothetical protein
MNVTGWALGDGRAIATMLPLFLTRRIVVANILDSAGKFAENLPII